jgi:hypothetical protein
MRRATREAIKIRNEGYPQRCEICHQSDCFDPRRGLCLRCRDILTMATTGQCAPVKLALRPFVAPLLLLTALKYFSYRIETNEGLGLMLFFGLMIFFCWYGSAMTQQIDRMGGWLKTEAAVTAIVIITLFSAPIFCCRGWLGLIGAAGMAIPWLCLLKACFFG